MTIHSGWLTAAIPMDNPYCSCKGGDPDSLFALSPEHLVAAPSQTRPRKAAAAGHRLARQLQVGRAGGRLGKQLGKQLLQRGRTRVSLQLQ